MFEKMKTEEGKQKMKGLAKHGAGTIGSLLLAGSFGELARLSLQTGAEMLAGNDGLGEKVYGTAFLTAGIVNGGASFYSLGLAGKNAKAAYEKGIKDIIDDIPDIIDIDDDVDVTSDDI